MNGMFGNLSFDPVGGWTGVLLVATVLIGMLWLGPDRSKTSGRQRVVLSALRFAGIFVLLFIMARPALLVTQTTRQSATLLLLLDRSRSMQVADSLGEASRFETLRAMLADAQPELAEIAETMEIKVYEFDTELTPSSIDEGRIALADLPEGKQSAIGAAIEALIAREAGKRIVGIVLASDGAQRAYAPFDVPPSIAAGRVADLGYPLYTVAFGQAGAAGQARDVAVDELLVSPTVYVKNRLDITTTIRVRGYASKEISVQLLYEVEPGKMTPVATQKIRASRDGLPQTIQFDYTPQTPGEHRLTIQAAEQPGELVTTNNATSTFVTVLKGGLNVLYLASGYPREQRDVRWSLAASPDVQLVTEYFGSLRSDRKQWPLTLPQSLKPERFDVIVLGDLDVSVLTQKSWQAIADRVEAGAGLMMHGGFHSFGPGGFRDSPLASVLPITIDRLERQGFDEPPSADMHLKGPLRLRPARGAGGVHPILMLTTRQKNASLFSQLPPLDGANRFRGLKRVAVVLAETDATPHAPLLVAGTYGSGRVLASALDSTFRWIEAGHDLAHRRFWRQAILWLAKKDAARDGRVWIRLAGRRFRPGLPVRFTAGLSQTEGEAPDDVVYRAEVVSPDGQQKTISMARSGKTARGAMLETTEPGEYQIRVTASAGDADIGMTRSRFLVFQQDLELDNPAANPALLARLAAQTSDLGGRAIAAEELPSLLRELAQNPPDLEIETELRKTYWDTWPVLLTFVALLGVEWYLRKRWGLV